MGLRYTAVAGMEQTSPRNPELDMDHWRDKIELRLDNRQVFFLFFGSAVVACMLFVLGVMVGKRIESRGQAQAPELSDPLAALDRAHAVPAMSAPASAAVPAAVIPQQPLAFPNTLMAGATAPKPAVPKLAAKPVVKPAAPKTVALVQKPAPVVVAAPAAPKTVALVQKPAPAAVSAPAAPRPLAPIVAAPAAPRPLAAVIAAPASAPADPTKTKGKFTLHLSTFATSEEASLFVKRYPGAFVVAGDVPGKGMIYRVRYGNFASFKDATAAKESFEKQHNAIALVAAR